jgi:ABC-type transport system substrate-binding protein
MIILGVFFSSLLVWTAHADLPRSVPFLHQFGDQPTPAAGSPEFEALTAFMEKSRRGGTLKLAFNESFVSIFPSAIRGGDFRARAPLASPFLFESLFTTDPRQDEYTIYPLGAKRVTASDDFCRLHVELREEFAFADGTPVRTADVKFSLDKFVDEFFSGAMAELIHHTWGKPVLTPQGDLAFDVEFTELPATGCRQGAYYFLSGTPLVKPNPAARQGDVVEMPYIGTGPYLVEHAERALLRYRRNPNYWANPHEQRQHAFNPDSIEVRVFVDPILERFALLRGETNLLREQRFTYDDWMAASIKDRPITFIDQVSDELTAESGAIHMNQLHVHTADPNFRRALLLAWDLETASREFYGNRRHAIETPGGQSRLHPHGSPSPEVMALLAKAKDTPEYAEAIVPADQLTYARLGRPRGERARLRLALEWLAKSGYRLARVDGKTKLVKDGRPVVITAITKIASPELRLFLLFQRQLKKLGIQLDIREFGDRTALVAALKNNQYDLFPGGISIPRDFTILNSTWLGGELHSKSITQLGGWSRVNSKLMDAVIDDLETRSPGTPEYRTAVDATLRAFNALVPVLPTGEVDTVRTYHHRDLHLWGNRDRDIWTLYF